MASTSSSNQRQERPILSTSGRELLLDLKRSIQRSTATTTNNTKNHIPVLPTYNNKLVQACLQDLHTTVQELDLKVQAYTNNETMNDNDNNDDGEAGSTNKPNMAARPVILLHDESIQRYKRCLLAYHYTRMNIIKDIQSKKPIGNGNGTTTATSLNPVSNNAHEVQFAKEYLALREQYSHDVFSLNILPPTSHMVQVRVLQSIGQVILPESGRSVHMIKGSCLFLDRLDIEDFVQQGIVQIYDGEEIDF